MGLVRDKIQLWAAIRLPALKDVGGHYVLIAALFSLGLFLVTTVIKSWRKKVRWALHLSE